MIVSVGLAVQIAILAVLVVAPALFFLALWRGLEFLQDDELVAQMEAMQGQESPSPPASAGVSGRADPRGESIVRCRRCGTPNRAEATYCHECLEELPG